MPDHYINTCSKQKAHAPMWKRVHSNGSVEYISVVYSKQNSPVVIKGTKKAEVVHEREKEVSRLNI